MLKEIIASGKDVAEAKENARAALGAGPLDDVNFEVLHAGSKGIFGIIGVKPAQVKASIELPDKPGRRPNTEGAPKREGNLRRDKQPREAAPAPKQNRPAKPTDKKPRPERTETPRAPKNEEKVRSAVIPETELKFEKLTVADGEDMSFEFVKRLLTDIGLDASAELFSCEDGTRRITISGTDASVLIGHHGDTLDALQYLTNLASAQKNINGERNKSRVTIDIEGYRAKREETLRALARRMAAKALRNKRSVMLEPMSAYERRIIHSEVQNIEGVSTNSIGSDNNRKIVIYLTDKKPRELFDEEYEAPTVTPLKEEFSAADEDTAVINDTVSVSMQAEDDGTDVAVHGFATVDTTDDEADDETPAEETAEETAAAAAGETNENA